MMYIIRSGNHYADGLNFSPYFKREMRLRVRFDPSCLYSPRNSDDYDISKVAGFSSSISATNSIRLGFRCTAESFAAGKIELWSYYHVSGKHYERYMMTVAPYETVNCKLTDSGTLYSVSLLDSYGKVLAFDSISKPKTSALGLKQYPYFGGNNTAPHDMRLEVEWV